MKPGQALSAGYLVPSDLRISQNQRVLNRLADVLIDAHTVLGIVSQPNVVGLAWVEPHIKLIYDDVDKLMRRLCE
jgi:hypothetical protein